MDIMQVINNEMERTRRFLEKNNELHEKECRLLREIEDENAPLPIRKEQIEKVLTSIKNEGEQLLKEYEQQESALEEDLSKLSD